jgi:hypothetical protein
MTDVKDSVIIVTVKINSPCLMTDVKDSVIIVTVKISSPCLMTDVKNSVIVTVTDRIFIINILALDQ